MDMETDTYWHTPTPTDTDSHQYMHTIPPHPPPPMHTQIQTTQTHTYTDRLPAPQTHTDSLTHKHMSAHMPIRTEKNKRKQTLPLSLSQCGCWLCLVRLLVMGKEQFKNKKRVYQLIHQHMLPSKTPQQLRCHFYCSGKMVKDKSIVWVRSSFFPLLLDEAVKRTAVLFYYVQNESGMGFFFFFTFLGVFTIEWSSRLMQQQKS